jgi:hypothetical protein
VLSVAWDVGGLGSPFGASAVHIRVVLGTESVVSCGGWKGGTTQQIWIAFIGGFASEGWHTVGGGMPPV